MSQSILSDLCVERVNESSVNIHWKSTENIEITFFSGNSPQTIDKNSSIATANGTNQVHITGLNPYIRPYFEVAPHGEKSIIISERKVECEGTFNFRDMGGYKTQDNYTLKWGQLFRADGFVGLTEKGLIQLTNIGIKKIYDFRTDQEVLKSPDRLPKDGSIEYFHLPVKHGEFNFVHVMKRLQQGDTSWLTHDYMTKGYIKGIEEFKESWGDTFKKIVQNNGTPSIFHCTGGKDRTGTFAALIFLILGVPDL